MTTDDDAPGVSGVFRERFSSTDLGEVEEFFSATYADVTMSLVGDPTGFRVHHETVAGGGVALSRMRNTLSWVCTVAPLEDALIVGHVRSGRLRWQSHRYGEVRAEAGCTTLVAPGEEITNVTEEADISLVGLDRACLQRYAVAVCGIGELEFTALAPRSPQLRDHWRATVAHVRDDVLADPEVAAVPLVVDSAVRLLVATTLSTFPNNALAAVTDPEGPGLRGDVPASVLREVVDYLHTHAERPVAPDEVAGLACAPIREVDHALRRDRNTTTAMELWRARLTGAHHDLLDADPRSGVTVADIALRWGFTNHRSFVAAYSAAFNGRTPGQTLHR